jgi:sugar fermentation stimulation protein A
MRFPRPLLSATLLRRYKRFLADVRLPDGTTTTVHCPNSGSLLGVNADGLPIYLLDHGETERKYRYSWVLAKVGCALVNIETNNPNRIVHESVEARRIPELAGYRASRREVPYGRNSRIDILLESNPNDPRPCYVEVKCTTMREGDIAKFPDAVTERGLKHLVELRRQVRLGARAVQFFFCSRTDVASFAPADAIDPAYGKELRRAARGGVEVLAWRAAITLKGIELDAPIPVDLS